ncbi:hypothetical protein ACFVJK_33180 [Streptomyces sp. NPDC127172]|uniref:hypothetical protein n=1 Tax=Streptomyces sp. NPDC127172 TaxID=3345382 RepID=UPI00362F0261
MAMKKVYIQEGTILSGGNGYQCISTSKASKDGNVPVFLAPYDRDSERYDDVLAELAAALNQLMEAAYAKRKNDTLKLGLIVLDRGILPVWKRELEGDVRPEDYTDGNGLIPLDGKTDAEIAQILGFAKGWANG